MSAPKIFAPEYYERMRALEDASWWNAGMRDLAGRMLRGVGLPSRGRFLDVGCGSGQTMFWFHRHWPGWETLGLDVAREGLRAARAGADARVLAGSALELPLPDACVDAVITLDVLQHLPLGGGDVQALAEIRRVLRPGGVLFVRTNAQAVPFSPDDPQYNFHKYTPRELRRKLEESGFVVRRIGRVNALLGLAEIPRELRARRTSAGSYVGLLAKAPRRDPAAGAKRAWLGVESALVAAGFSLPLGRTLVALAEARKDLGPP
jgi:ubiquinone/menaquinone biosynthesis C-methylase UbiE